ncbi:MAG: Fic family protein [Vampirovibrionales bacterium]|nr:Fic family protein [Vampirovibrionales bacterium]
MTDKTAKTFLNRIGRRIKTSAAGESVLAYLPPPLPPDPPLNLTHLLLLHERAIQALGRLDGVAEILPDKALFLYQYVRKEALLSSQIEGTQSSFSDLLLHELAEVPGVPLDDVSEVSAYIAAIDHGLKRLGEGFPLSLRLLREIHGILLATGRGKDKLPGEFRQSQNWIGGSRPGNALFVPPPADHLMDCLDAFEKFLHETDSGLPTLLKAGLAHVQFETIHPFLDGNGRLGRLMITLLLCHAGLMKQPIFYLSLYFKAHRATYYQLLDEVRMNGVWETWLEFFLEGVIETATEAQATAKRILALVQEDGQRTIALGRGARNAHRVLDLLQEHPILTIQWVSDKLGITHTTAAAAFQNLMTLGIVEEITGRRRSRLFAYREYLEILSEGADPL